LAELPILVVKGRSTSSIPTLRRLFVTTISAPF